MKLTPMFASDTTAAFLGFAVLIFIVVAATMGLILGIVAIALNRKIHSRNRSGFILSLSPLPFSLGALGLALLIFNAPTIAGFPNGFLIPISLVPMVPAAYALVLWRRSPRK